MPTSALRENPTSMGGFFTNCVSYGFKFGASSPKFEKGPMWASAPTGCAINPSLWDEKVPGFGRNPAQEWQKDYLWIRPLPSPPASFSTSATVTML